MDIKCPTANAPVYFLHIPKTAGTSLTSFMDQHFAPSEICPAQLLPELFEIPKDTLARYRFIRGHLWYGLHEYINCDLKYMTMLRDPVARTISFYHHVRRDPLSYRHNRLIQEKWTLEDFVSDAETNWDIVNTQTLFVAAELDFDRLSLDPGGYGRAAIRKYAQNPADQKLLNRAKKRLERFCFIGITENLEDSFALLCSLMGWGLHFEVQHLNSSDNQAMPLEAPDRALDKIREFTQLDSALYRWAQELFQDRLSRMRRKGFCVRKKPLSRYVDFTFAQGFSGTGWHGFEQHEGTDTCWRWTGPGTQSSLEFHLIPDRQYAFEITILHSMQLDIIHGMHIMANNQPLVHELFYAEDGGNILKGIIPKPVMSTAEGSLLLTIQTPKTISPHSINNASADTRLLGVAVSRVRVFKAIESKAGFFCRLKNACLAILQS